MIAIDDGDVRRVWLSPLPVGLTRDADGEEMRFSGMRDEAKGHREAGYITYSRMQREAQMVMVMVVAMADGAVWWGRGAVRKEWEEQREKQS